MNKVGSSFIFAKSIRMMIFGLLIQVWDKICRATNGDFVRRLYNRRLESIWRSGHDIYDS